MARRSLGERVAMTVRLAPSDAAKLDQLASTVGGRNQAVTLLIRAASIKQVTKEVPVIVFADAETGDLTADKPSA